MLDLRTHALVTGGLFAVLSILGWGGNAVDAYGLIPHTPGVQIGALVFFLLLTAALAFSAVPRMVLLVVRFHIAAGNANRPGIRSVIAHAHMIVFVIWGLMAAGLLLAVPAAIAEGAFSSPDQR
jgi:hypothetical protein